MGVFLISKFLVNLLLKKIAITPDGIDVNLRPVTKRDKRNKTTSKNFDDDGMLENWDIIVVFLIYGQFIVCKTYIFIKSSL